MKKIEPDDFLKEKFRPLRNLTDLPKSYMDKWEASQKLVDHHMQQLTETDKALPALPHMNPEGLARFVAFQTVQIQCLQEELKVFYQGLDKFQEVLDKKADKVPTLRN